MIRALETCGTMIKRSNIYIIKVPEGKRGKQEESGAERIFEEIMPPTPQIWQKTQSWRFKKLCDC